ncbi:MAG: hypothetical protein A2Z29_05720 [Chloroflexi bacterium RBG_16_56_11]|nr:MAG: hypothetical protein A2Z29_05720 [Chloroflexi bacterium RBG_16_56_11]
MPRVKKLFPAASAGPQKGRLVSPGFLAGTSHDIRSLLYIIIGFAELLLDEVPGKINEEQRRSLEDILRSGQRLTDLLGDYME